MADHGMIVGTVFAHRAVDDLDVTRSISEAPALHPPKEIEGQVMAVDLVEWWFFRRRSL